MLIFPIKLYSFEAGIAISSNIKGSVSHLFTNMNCVRIVGHFMVGNVRAYYIVYNLSSDVTARLSTPRISGLPPGHVIDDVADE